MTDEADEQVRVSRNLRSGRCPAVEPGLLVAAIAVILPGIGPLR